MEDEAAEESEPEKDDLGSFGNVGNASARKPHGKRVRAKPLSSCAGMEEMSW